MNSNLDVWAIQSLPSELKTALDNIKTDNDIIIFTNVLSNFNLGGEKIVSRQFDTFLYSEENDILLMLMRGGEVIANDIRSYLDNKGFVYHEVSFAPISEKHEDDKTIPELWFAREEYVVDDAFADSISRTNNRGFDYFPFLEGSLSLGYTTDVESDDLNYLDEDKEAEFQVDGRLFRGLIRLEDKLILLINQGDKRNVTAESVNKIAKKYGFSCTVLENKDFSLESVQSKKLTK